MDGTQDDKKIVSVGHDGMLKIHSLKSGKLIRSIAISSVSLCSCVHYQTANSSILVVGSWDNSLYEIKLLNFFFTFHVAKIVFIFFSFFFLQNFL